MPDSATITFQLAREDVARTLWRRIVSRPRYLRSVGFFLALGLLALAAGRDFTLAGVLLVAHAVLRPLVAWQVIMRAVSASALLTDRRTVEFGQSGITASGPDWKASLPWRHFKGWSEDDRNFYLDVTASGVASILPKGAMTVEQQQLLRTCLALIPAPGKARP